MIGPALTPEGLAEIRDGKARSRSEQLADAKKEGGLVLTTSEEQRLAVARPYRPIALYAKPQRVSERWSFACARIYRILQGCQRSVTLTGAIAGAEYPELARAYGELYAYYLTRARQPPMKGEDHNPFRHLSDVDAFRKFVRLVEDICDKSTGKLGSWYVK